MTAYPVTLDTADLATIRAALCLYHDEEMGEPDNRPDHVHSLAINYGGEECISLDNAAVLALFERLRPDALKAASPGADYLDRFPPEHRESADRAYQDGFADGANAADDDGEESEGEAAPPFRAVFSLEIDLDRLEAIGAQAVDALEAASLELENNGAFLAGPVEIDGEAVGIMGYAPADQLRKPKAQSASPDPEGQSAPEWSDDALDSLTDDATHAVNNLIPDSVLEGMTQDERSALLVRINDALSPILAEALDA